MDIVLMAIVSVKKAGENMDEQRIKESMINDDEIEIDLVELFFDFFKLLRKYWKLMIAVVIIVTVAFSGFRYLTYSPMYRCEATFTVATGNQDEESGVTSYDYYYSSTTADQLSKTFPYILESSYFNSMLLNKLGTDQLNGTLSAETVTDSNMVTMTVESSNPQDAMNILTGAIEIYPEVASFVLGTIQFHMVNNAQMPTVPYNQVTLVKTVGLGVLLGLAVGCMILGLMALFRKTVKNPEQMSKISSLKCLATIPKVKYKARHSQDTTRISVLDHRTSYNFKESMRSLQLHLERQMQRQTHKIIVVTSSISGEGKSTVSLNLAETFAANGKKVLLIDGDLRKPSLAHVLQCKDSKSLKEMYQRFADDMSAISKMTHDNLYFIGNHDAESNPVSVLSDQRLGQYLNQLKNSFDYIIIDTPPCGIFQDALMLQKYADALVYIVQYDTLTAQKIQEGLSLLRDDHCVMGYVFNNYEKMTPDYGYGKYGYGYGYGYGKYNYGYKNKG